MKVIRLEAENIKRLEAIDITPEGHLVEITGKNGAGKTSVLDALWWALAGTGTIQSQPIRRGQERARIKLDLGDLIITRRFNKQEDGSFTTSVTVENADGARYPSPQSMLDALVGSLTFDPLDFTRKKAKDQFETLKRLTGLDFADIEKANAEDYAERTIVNRRVRDLRGVAASLEQGLPDEEPQKADEAGLIKQLVEASAWNLAIEKDRASRQTVQERIEGIQTRIRNLTEEMHGLQAKQATLPELATPVDAAAISARLDEAKAANEVYDQWEERNRILTQAEAGDAEAEVLSARMEKRNADKRQMIAETKMPVDGLGFGDGVVLLHEQPFDQGSDAEQLRASIAIAAAANPKLRVIRVRDGSLLDDDLMALLTEFATEHDMQVWVETVSSGRPGAIQIVDGVVAEPPAQPVKPRKPKSTGPTQETLL